jgi:hypothetical protein
VGQGFRRTRLRRVAGDQFYLRLLAVCSELPAPLRPASPRSVSLSWTLPNLLRFASSRLYQLSKGQLTLGTPRQFINSHSPLDIPLINLQCRGDGIRNIIALVSTPASHTPYAEQRTMHVLDALSGMTSSI